MRAKQKFTYVINNIPTPQPIFEFLQKHSGNNDIEMYGNFNMGAGFAIMLSNKDIKRAQQIAKKLGYKSWNAGNVQKGPKQVVINPKNIVLEGSSLDLR